MPQHWKDTRHRSETEAAEYEDNATAGRHRKLGHLTYINGKPVEGLCYCSQPAAHPVEPEQDAGLSGVLQ